MDWTSLISALIAPVPGTDGMSRGEHFEGAFGRIFGGQVIAQALMAASRDEQDDRQARSLHASFLRPGSVSKPVDYRVTLPFAGRSFATRQVVATQDDQPILILLASFHRSEDGLTHQAAVQTQVQPDEAQRRLVLWREKAGDRARLFSERLDTRPIELVPIDPDALFGAEPAPPRSAWWMRSRRPLAASPPMQHALLAYASDMMLLRNAMLPHRVRPFSGGVQTASLDHAIWFHETPDMNDWLLFETDSPWAGYARGLNRGHFFTAQGKMIATVTQESLMRLPAAAL
jgi:acyl-CoA thioesterase-2